MIDAFVQMFMANMAGEAMKGSAGTYTGYASGGKPSIHDVFKGGKITSYTPMNVPTTMPDGSIQNQVQNVPNRSLISGGNKANTSTPRINYNQGGGVGVGTYTPIQVPNRNNKFLENLLRFNPNLKGLL